MSIKLYFRNGENGIEEPWVCSTLTRYVGRDVNIKVPMATAEVVYRYVNQNSETLSSYRLDLNKTFAQGWDVFY